MATTEDPHRDFRRRDGTGSGTVPGVRGLPGLRPFLPELRAGTRGPPRPVRTAVRLSRAGDGGGGTGRVRGLEATGGRRVRNEATVRPQPAPGDRPGPHTR